MLLGVKIISKIFKITKIIYFIDGIKNYAVFKGRANRPKYWFFMLYWAIGYFLLIAIESSMGLNNIDFRAKGFPDELVDNEPEEKGYEI